jgi:hypothetical protein
MPHALNNLLFVGEEDKSMALHTLYSWHRNGENSLRLSTFLELVVPHA